LQGMQRFYDGSDQHGESATNPSIDLALSSDADQSEQMRYCGFLAQEVEAAANELGFEFSGVDAPESDTESTYGLRYGEFTVPLVKAVQELNEKVERCDPSAVLLLTSEVQSLRTSNEALVEESRALAEENQLLREQLSDVLKRLDALESVRQQ
jgi:hypothetical protein